MSNSGKRSFVAHESSMNGGDLPAAIKEKGEAVSDAAARTVAHATKKLEQIADAAEEQAEDARTATGKGIESLAGKIRDKGPQEGILGSANKAVANAVESTGTYLKEHELTAISKDVADLIRHHPIQALLVGVGVGYLFGRVMRR